MIWLDSFLFLAQGDGIRIDAKDRKEERFMTLFQALLIALFGYLSSNYSPWCFGQLGGWYTMGRPLVSGLIIGVSSLLRFRRGPQRLVFV